MIASNYGGPKRPRWYFNLKAHAECQFGGEHFVATEVTDPAEYTRLFALAEKVFAGFGDYRVKTDPIGRRRQKESCEKCGCKCIIEYQTSTCPHRC